MDKRLKEFVIEQYNKIKKQKKSPKNYYVEVHPNSNEYWITTDNNEKWLELDDWKGNLYQLYTSINTTSEKKVIKKGEFNQNWIPILKELLLVSLVYANVKYEDLDELEKTILDKETFNNIINWIKNN